jgi:hypothetical protein
MLIPEVPNPFMGLQVRAKPAAPWFSQTWLKPRVFHGFQRDSVIVSTVLDVNNKGNDGGGGM